MKRFSWTLGIMIVAGMASAFAQPPGGRGGPGGGQGGGPGRGPRGARPPMPIIDVLDADHDHVISADELKNATKSLLTLDKNNDGKLTENEFGPGAANARGRGGPQGGPGGGQRPGPGDDRGPGGPGRRGPQDDGDGPPPPPSADRMVEHAMEFDADGDGMLSQDELLKFAKEIENHRRQAGGPQGGDGPGERPQRPE